MVNTWSMHGQHVFHTRLSDVFHTLFLSLTHSLTLSLTHTRTLTHTHNESHSRTLTLTHTQVKVWNLQSGFCFVTFTEHTAPVTAVQFLGSGHAVV